jgi:hypothetical protein
VREILERLRAVLIPAGEKLQVDILVFHGFSIEGRAQTTPAEPVGQALLELEKVPYRLGVKDGTNWLLPRDLVEALISRGLGEPLSAAESDVLAAWQTGTLPAMV